jgi:hypothetical protein
MKYRVIVVSERQSITDIAMQEYQDTSAVFKIMEDNIGLVVRDITSLLVPGMELKIRVNDNPSLEAQTYSKRGFRVNTGDGVIPDFDAIGIGNMTIARPRTNISQIFRVQ